jgi:hypothetical protein
MTHDIETLRRFRVHARDVDAHHARVVEETSFEAAAVAYLEGFDLATAAGGEDGIRVIVHEIATNHEHCFRVDLDTGAAAPCC